jgi:hypothetical protein
MEEEEAGAEVGAAMEAGAGVAEATEAEAIHPAEATEEAANTNPSLRLINKVSLVVVPAAAGSD